MNLNSDDYVQRYTMIAMAEEIQKMKYVIEELKTRNQKEDGWSEAEMLASVGLTYGE